MLAVVAMAGDDFIGVARVDGSARTGNAEVATVVEDHYRQHGLGTALPERLVADARLCEG
jgi:GNAT superfamily N-acetyltransferase